MIQLWFKDSSAISVYSPPLPAYWLVFVHADGRMATIQVWVGGVPKDVATMGWSDSSPFNLGYRRLI